MSDLIQHEVEVHESLNAGPVSIKMLLDFGLQPIDDNETIEQSAESYNENRSYGKEDVSYSTNTKPNDDQGIGADGHQVIELFKPNLLGDNWRIIALPPGAQLFDSRGKAIQLTDIRGSSGKTVLSASDSEERGDDCKSTHIDPELGKDKDSNSIQSFPSPGGSFASLPPCPRKTPQHIIPQNCPNWASRLLDLEKLAKYYRGWVENEIELDLLLTLHKQQTKSAWGIRQSPSIKDLSTRFMWKSHYVPFDGIPFVNLGSRAVVMECAYGPRRKGSHRARISLMDVKGPPVDHIDSNGKRSNFVPTCPARIYIKKVRKFTTFAIDVNKHKKTLKFEMEKMFYELKKANLDEVPYQDRYYVQLPTENAHEYHAEMSEPEVAEPCSSSTANLGLRDSLVDPRVREKIQELVKEGEYRLYVIRKALRHYVDTHIVTETPVSLDHHDLSLFPTVHTLQNEIFQAMSEYCPDRLQDVQSMSYVGNLREESQGTPDSSFSMPIFVLQDNEEQVESYLNADRDSSDSVPA